MVKGSCRSNLDNCTVAELKAKLRAKKLPVSGKKAELVARLRSGKKASKKASRSRSRGASKKASRSRSRGASKKASRHRGSKKSSRRGSKKGKIKLGPGEAYDVTCGKKCKVVNPRYTVTRKGGRTTHLLRGTCPDGHKVARIISKADYDAHKGKAPKPLPKRP